MKLNLNLTSWGKAAVFVLIYCTFLSVSAAQITLNGVVAETDFKPIDQATIILYEFVDETEKQIIAYSYSTKTGSFALICDSLSVNSQYYIIASKLGYSSDSLIITTTSSIESIELYLQFTSIELNEVEIKAPVVPIYKHGDTTTYVLSEFNLDGTETLSDILQRLPGFSISPDGSVAYNGKSIKSLLLEDDDLLGNRYASITKNLSSSLVGGIQVINNYSDNPVISNVVDTDDLAINVKLKDSKTNISGEAKIGGGYPDKYSVLVNTFMLSKRNKVYVLNNIDNLGNLNSLDETRSQTDNTSFYAIREYNRSPTQSQFSASIPQYNIPLRYYGDISTSFNSANWLHKYSDKIRLKLFAAQTRNKITFNRNVANSFNDQSDLSYSSDISFNSNAPSLVGGLDLSYTDALSTVKFKSEYFSEKNNWRDIYNYTTYDGNDKVNSRSNTFKSNLDITRLLNEHSYFRLSLSYDQLNSPTQSIFRTSDNFPLFLSAITSDSISIAKQSFGNKHFGINGVVQFVYKSPRVVYDFRAGYSFAEESILNSIFLNNSNISLLSNGSYKIGYRDYWFNGGAVYSFSEHLSANTKIAIFRNSVSPESFDELEELRYNKVYPTFTFKYKNEKLFESSLAFGKNRNILFALDSYTGAVLLSHRTFSQRQSSIRFKDYSTRFVGASIKHGDFTNRLFVNASIYILNDDLYDKATINASSSLSQKDYSTGTDRLTSLSSLGLNYYVQKYYTNFKLNGSIYRISDEYTINKFDFARNIISTSLSLSAKTVYNLKLNTLLELVYNRSKTNSNKVDSWSTNLEVNYNVNSQFRVQLNNNLNIDKLSEDSDKMFSNYCDIKLAYKAKKLNWIFWGRNLFSQNYYQRTFISALETTRVSFPLNSREFLLTCEVGF